MARQCILEMVTQDKHKCAILHHMESWRSHTSRKKSYFFMEFNLRLHVFLWDLLDGVDKIKSTLKISWAKEFLA